MTETACRNTFGPEATTAFTRANAALTITASSRIICATAIQPFLYFSMILVGMQLSKYLLQVARLKPIHHVGPVFIGLGVITDKKYLPITRLNFGRTQFEISSGVHTLGKLECTEQVTVNGIPKSCSDLWKIGNTLSGIYSVMGSDYVKTVYCDFARLPHEQGETINKDVIEHEILTNQQGQQPYRF